MGCSHHCLTETYLILAFRTTFLTVIKYKLQSEKEHLSWIQKLIPGPTKVQSTAIPLRRQLWVAKSHSPYQGVNPTSISNISTQRTNLRAALAGVSLWLWLLSFLSCSRNLARRPHSCWTQQPKQLPGQALLFVLLIASLPPSCSPQSLPKQQSAEISLTVRAKIPSPSYVQKPKYWNESGLFPEMRQISHFTAYSNFPKTFATWVNKFKNQNSRNGQLSTFDLGHYANSLPLILPYLTEGQDESVVA